MTSSIQTSVKYLKNDQSLAVYKASVAGGELVSHEGNYVEHTVLVENARDFVVEPELDREGFRLVEQSTQVTDFYDDTQLSSYEAEIKSLLYQVIKASHIEIFDHTRRSSSASVRSERSIREASSVIHNDYSAASGHARLQDYINSAEHIQDNVLINRDFAIINVWRSANGTIANHPLAMCVATSVVDSDLVPVKREGKERMGELQLMLHAPTHRWCYFPQMTYQEALIFKTFDSRNDGRTRFTAHTSIADPNASVNSPPRESIETRCFVFF